MAEAYQRTAVLAAAVRTGVADAIVAPGATAAEIAQNNQCDVRGVTALLGALSALGLAERAGDRFQLTAGGAPLARSHPQTVALIVEKEWFFYGAWAGIEQTVRDGHARVAPWRERLREDPQRSLDFLRALDDLARLFGGELVELAGPGPAGALLDVGGGAGSHAAGLVEARPGLQATVLDLPEVEAVQRERHPELSFIEGDLEWPRFGRPDGERWDCVLLANILHDHAPDRAAWIVREAAGLLRDGGTMLVYEWVLDQHRDSPAPVAMFALMMMIENEGGSAYTEPEISGWLADAGLEQIETRRGVGPIAVIRAVK
jgi:SAM-dependent methyltransferase